MIRACDLSRVFNSGPARVTAVDRVNLEISAAETVAIQGPSGSGKSTLLSLLGLLDDATFGEIWFHDHRLTELTHGQKRELRNAQIGWVFQNFNLIGQMTVLENVALPLRYNPAVASGEYHERAMQVLDQVGLAAKAESHPGELSGGQQQRVAIARALVQDPRLLLADEPTGNLDQATGNKVIDLLLELCSRGTTMIMVTHDDGIATRCARRIRMADGHLIDAG